MTKSIHLAHFNKNSVKTQQKQSKNALFENLTMTCKKLYLLSKHTKSEVYL